MDLPVIATVQREEYIPGASDPVGLAAGTWAEPVPVDSHGWWQPSADDIAAASPGRRSQSIVRCLMVPNGTACGDRDRWTLPGDGTYSQDGEPQDYSHGPFGMQTPLVVYLKTVEG